jgi:hypothetical protein
MLSRTLVMASAAALAVTVVSPSANAVTYVGLDLQDIPFFPNILPFSLPAGGELVESRITLDLQIAPGRDPSTLVLTLFVPHQGPGDTFAVTDHTLLAANEFIFDGTTLRGTYSTTALNGNLYVDEFGQSAPWQLQIWSPFSFDAWGVGDLHAEFDVVPEPASLTWFALGAAGFVQRRMRGAPIHRD